MNPNTYAATTSPAFLLKVGGVQVNGTFRYFASSASTSVAVLRMSAIACSTAILNPQKCAVMMKDPGTIHDNEKTSSTDLAIALPSCSLRSSQYRNTQFAFRLAG